jgi:hypothetical protein
MWIGIGILQVSTTTLRRHDHIISGPTFRNATGIFVVIIWCLLIALYSTKSLFGGWQFTTDALNFHWLGNHGTKIPYNSIVAVRPQPDANLEIETARVSRDIYPHNYVIIAPKDRTGFLQALRSHLPPEVFEAV